MEELRGRTALITGSSRGIGAAIARVYAEHGMRVAINYRQDAERATKTLAGLPGEGHLCIQADISNPEQVRTLIERAVKEFGRLDVLVNNAAIYEFQPFFIEDYAAWQAAWKRVLDTDLVSAVNATYCALPTMKAQGGGKVLFIGSRGGFRGETDAPAYAVSKMGLVGFTRSLARALAKERIYAYGIAPGWTNTEMSAPRMAGQMDRILAEIPMGRVASVEDVAGVALFLASDAADYLTGLTLLLTGGQAIF
jgi:NAD(P)-dependent dehydrogenase (short-subunit alcohol dehydrogenase family)